MPAMKRTREERIALAARKKRAFRQKAAWKSRQIGKSRPALNLTSVPRGITPPTQGYLGQTFETELCYADYFSLDPGIGAPTTYVFSCNGLYDPNITSTGHQPHGFDQMMVNYNNYIVTASAIEVVLFPYANVAGTSTQNLTTGAGTSTAPQIMGSFLSVCVRDKLTAMTGALVSNFALLERPGMKTKFVNSNSSPTKVSHSWSIPQFYGKARDAKTQELSGTVTNNPDEQNFYHIIFGPPDGSTNLPEHQFVVRMKFKVRFYNPVDVATS